MQRTKKGAARGCKRPKSREETPKEGGGNATRSRYRAATICHRAAQKARVTDVILGIGRRPVAAGADRRLPHPGSRFCPAQRVRPGARGLVSGYTAAAHFGGGRAMTAVDFSAFVDELAS